MLFDQDPNRDIARQSANDHTQGWLPLSPNEAREWSHVLTDFSPRPGSVLFPWFIGAAHGRGLPPVGYWAATAKEFDAAGFAPLDWYLLRLTFEIVATEEERRLIERPAAEWADWLAARRDERLTPLAAMKRVLGRKLPWEH